MKLTISSSSMLKPLLLAGINTPFTPPPDRLTGLLTARSGNSSYTRKFEKIVEYHRPHTAHPRLSCAKWTDYLAVNDDQFEESLAVFGFNYDGEQTWYQLWNNINGQLVWVMHDDTRVYEPFAIRAMDALVSLIPQWKGWLYPAPGCASARNPFSPRSANQIDAQSVHNLRVSDSSTDLSGHLWFLVTVYTNCIDKQRLLRKAHEHAAPDARSGWITHLDH